MYIQALPQLAQKHISIVREIISERPDLTDFIESYVEKIRLDYINLGAEFKTAYSRLWSN